MRKYKVGAMRKSLQGASGRLGWANAPKGEGGAGIG